MYVFIYIHIYVSTYIHTYVCVCAYIYVYTNMYMYTYVYIQMHINTSGTSELSCFHTGIASRGQTSIGHFETFACKECLNPFLEFYLNRARKRAVRERG